MDDLMINFSLSETNDDMFLGGKRRSSGLDGGQSADSKKDKEKSRRRSRSLSSLTNLKISLHVPTKPKGMVTSRSHCMCPPNFKV